jgi:hypothetical protein
MRGRALVFAAATMAIATSSFAQPKEPIGRFVVDVRAASVGLPTAVGWVPVVPEGTEVPARSLGLEVGAHVYLARLGPMTLGVGATYLTARKSTVPPEIAEGPTPPPPVTIPEVTTRMSSLAPQVSLNFGHASGWSYVSVGLGQSNVESEAVLAPPGATVFQPLESGWTTTLNYGGGARWFLNDHVGIGFDLRWHTLSTVPTTATHPGAPRTTLFTAGLGVVLK